MRQERITQTSIFDVFAKHEIGCELKAISEWLDEHRALLGLVAGDLRPQQVKETGRQGLPAEAVAAMRFSQAASPAELRGVGVPSGGLGVVPGPCPAADIVDPEKIRSAKDHRCDPGGDLGGD